MVKVGNGGDGGETHLCHHHVLRRVARDVRECEEAFTLDVQHLLPIVVVVVGGYGGV